MAGDLKQKFGTSNQSITCGIASLANNSLRQSTYVDNATNLYMDVLVFVKVKSGASGTSTSGYINVYAYATADGGSTYTDGASGSDSAITPTSPTNLKFIGMVNVVANATTYYGGPFSLAAAFGCVPERWGIVIENKTGGTLDTTAGNHSVTYQGLLQQSA